MKKNVKHLINFYLYGLIIIGNLNECKIIVISFN